MQFWSSFYKGMQMMQNTKCILFFARKDTTNSPSKEGIVTGEDNFFWHSPFSSDIFIIFSRKNTLWGKPQACALTKSLWNHPPHETLQQSQAQSTAAIPREGSEFMYS